MINIPFIALRHSLTFYTSVLAKIELLVGHIHLVKPNGFMTYLLHRGT